MQRSLVEVYLHIIWATRGRDTSLSAETQRAVYRCIVQEAGRLCCQVLAIGGTETHVHLCVKVPATVDLARLMNQVKGVSSHLVHEQLGQPEVAWQANYAAFSVSKQALGDVVAYVEHQREHHRCGTLRDEWEQTCIELPDGP